MPPMSTKADNGFNVFLLKLQTIVKTKIGISRTAPSSPVSKKKFIDLSNSDPIGLTNKKSSMKKSKTTEEFMAKDSSVSERLKQSKQHKKASKLFRKNEFKQSLNESDYVLKEFSLDLSNSPAPVNNKASIKFQKIFSIESSELLVKSFSCALVDEILFQGTFYVSRNYFCFYTKIANRRKVIKVAVENVDNITREKTAGIIPNAIAIHTKTERFLFTSFMLRDSTFRFISEIWESRKSECNTTLNWISDVNLDKSSIQTRSSLSCGPMTGNEDTVKPSVITTSTALATHLGASHPTGVSSVKKSENEHMSHWPLSQTKTWPNRNQSTKLKQNKYTSRTSLSSHSSFVEFGQLVRNEFLLLTAYFILIILTATAVFMAYRVHCFQQILLDRVKSLSPSIATSISDTFDTDSLLSKLQST